MLRSPVLRFRLKSSRNAAFRLCLAVAVCAAVAGCGRRGGLEYPVDPNDPQIRDSGQRVHSSGREGQKVIRGYVTPDKKFILDPLL
ncbi:putative small lipoprotein YifL [Pseudochelatococcus lubricantis]|uniref:Small lipoprotein YifL n=1 Tax=Pseudochelatococcus lubricantis TaxID=1538102 RepID=A0ABX0UZ99_9HYPH|nr:putative small lipoprotein YifL [Pseudochelatococcus lubricantis]